VLSSTVLEVGVVLFQLRDQRLELFEDDVFCGIMISLRSLKNFIIILEGLNCNDLGELITNFWSDEVLED